MATYLDLAEKAIKRLEATVERRVVELSLMDIYRDELKRAVARVAALVSDLGETAATPPQSDNYTDYLTWLARAFSSLGSTNAEANRLRRTLAIRLYLSLPPVAPADRRTLFSETCNALSVGDSLRKQIVAYVRGFPQSAEAQVPLRAYRLAGRLVSEYRGVISKKRLRSFLDAYFAEFKRSHDRPLPTLSQARSAVEEAFGLSQAQAERAEENAKANLATKRAEQALKDPTTLERVPADDREHVLMLAAEIAVRRLGKEVFETILARTE